ncbi:MAG: SDR family NAD(P)-dependent oxidoreductase [Clostridia bacterium]|nr:SDR family NAD(P)-dependent oxidoreductase [Clostridia bacterium]
MKKPDKKVVVITGATSGIGLSTAKIFLSDGYKVYGIARKPYTGNDFTCYSADVCDYDEIKRIFAEIHSREGRIDILVNNAGMGIAGAMEETSVERIEQIVSVNLTAPCVLSGLAVRYLKDGGKIINVSSVGGIMPLPYQAMYSATKAGAEIFSRALANEVKPYNIKVCAVLPGDTKTGFTAARVCEGENERAKKSVEKMARDEQRGKSPESVAKVICKVAKKKNPPLRVTVGASYKLLVFLQRILPVKLVNFIIRKMYC